MKYQLNIMPPIIASDDIEIGANVTVGKDSSIGNKAIIGTNSIVKSDVPPFSLGMGVPARITRTR